MIVLTASNVAGVPLQMMWINRVFWQFILCLGSIYAFLLDAIVINRKMKILCCSLWAANCFYQIQNHVWHIPNQGWIKPVVICLAGECINTFNVYVSTLFTVALFCSKFAVALLLEPEALMIIKSAVIRQLR